ncbi:MAG: ABC transporter ATP-binding protein [Ilumatobacter sp.]|uniref:ABC transporter ATP-binding protein n=1 Tax=Ilumatobacter sp. TaxID=1967498 RepID=UPI00391A0E15
MSNDGGARWRALAALLRPDAGRWVILGVLVSLGAALALAGPLIVRRIVDSAAAGTTASAVVRLALAYLVVALLTQAVAVVVVWHATIAAWRTTNELRVTMAAHVLGLDHEFHRRNTPGELIQRVDGDVTSVSDFLGLVVPKALGALVLLLGMVGVLAVLDWRLAIGMLVYICAALAVVVRSRHRAVAESADEMGASARLYGGIEERLTAAEDLRALGAATHVAWRFVEDSTAAMTSSIRRERAFLAMWWMVQMAVAAGSVIALIVSGALVAAEVISIGTAFLLFQYILLITRPLEDVVHQLETVQKANGAMVRVLDLLALQPTVIDVGSGGGATSPSPGPLSVEFAGVSFDYGDDAPVLRDVDLTLEAGRTLGVVGRTGSGKTTASRLVLRLVEATQGVVSLGGVPIDEIPLDELRRRVALVPQEVELFAGSIRDNVTLFDDEPSEVAVVDALRRVGLDDLAISGIDRPLGAGGAGLSAGQAQLLAMARVWLRSPDVIVFDEATARIDPETESRLDAAVTELLRGRTAIVIAHRLTTLRAADDIVVFSDGRIIEHGRRADLLADDDSRFAALLALSIDQFGSQAR